MATVFIWNNNQITHKFGQSVGYNPSAKEVVGHACMNIRDEYVSLSDRGMRDVLRNEEMHVSWWPGGGGADKQDRGDGMGKAGASLLKDILIEGYVPDHVIRIVTPPPAFILRMEREWNRQRQQAGEPNSYHFMKENCSRIVSRVLRRGYRMGRGNIKYGNVVSGLWTPLMVQRLALDLKGGSGLDVPARQMLWSEFVDELVDASVVFPQTGSLMKLMKRRASNRGSSGAAARFDFSKADNLLERFSKAKLAKFKGEKGFPTSLLIYSEARGHRYTMDEARQFLTRWLDREIGLGEREDLEDEGLLEEMIHLAENVPTPTPKRPPRGIKKKRAAGGSPPKPPKPSRSRV